MADAHSAGARSPSTFGVKSSGGETALIAAIAIYIGVFAVWPLARLFYEALLPGRVGHARVPTSAG